MGTQTPSELLALLFELDELLQIVKGVFGKEADRLIQQVAQEGGKRERIASLLSGMERRGLLADRAFLAALEEERPRRSAEIRSLAAAFGLNEVAEEPSAKPGGPGVAESTQQVVSRHTVTRQMAQELFRLEWTTFGLALLKNVPTRPDAGSDYVDWLDRTTAALFEGPRSSEDEAIRLLREWLDVYPAHPAAPPLRLRLAMFHKHQSYDRKDPVRWKTSLRKAIEAIDPLIEQFPDFAALHCLRGNFLTWLDRFSESLPCFERARELFPEWMEPRLQEVEACILLTPDADYLRAASVAEESLTEARHARERLLFYAHKVVARVCAEPKGEYARQEYKAEVFEVRKIRVPEDQREAWSTGQVVQLLSRLRGAVLEESIADDLIDLMKHVELSLSSRVVA